MCTLIVAVVLMRVARAHPVTIHDPIIQGTGCILLLSGLGFAVWARLHLGRNWGMPMTQKAQPELVTSGPYAYVRHPIYFGILVAMTGTALATNPCLFIAWGAMTIYFAHSARAEEALLTRLFPTSYPRYRNATKMLIPFTL
jgi:protein-S-isoprenylcysteine O-methyltransferase Ste14